MAQKRTYLQILMHIARLLERRVTDELGALELCHGQARTLAILLDEGAIIQADLARCMAIRPATLTRMLKPLKARKLISTETDPATNRAIFVELTPQGRKAAAAATKAWDRVERELTGEVNGSDRDQLLKHLEAFRNVLGGEDPEQPRAMLRG